jgi:L-ornithine N5-monooxygenase
VPEERHDVIGVGAGPANISLAVALDETRPGVDSIFLERSESFAWHGDLLLPGAVIMDTFLEDGVLLRNPRSRFTFLNYLHQHGWLHDFNNLREVYPTRQQYSDYLRWVCSELGDVVRFGEVVHALEPIFDGRVVAGIRVVCESVRSGKRWASITRNVVVATGGVPELPSGIAARADGRVFHASRYLSSIERVCPDRDRAYRLAVVGSGQTGAEVFMNLASTYPRARVTATLRKFGYRLQDDSPFAWDLYYSKVVDHFFGQPPDRRADAIDQHLGTNYGAVSWRVLKRMYDLLWEDRVSGTRRLEVRPNLELRAVSALGPTVVATFVSPKEGPIELEYDAVVLATGYQRTPPPLIEGIARYLEHDSHGRLMADRNYRVNSQPEFSANVYLQGFCEHTHGVGDANLPIIPTRSAELAATLIRDVHGFEREPSSHR